MSNNCNGQCADCLLDCKDREKKTLRESPHELSRIRKVIGVVSGKGGVGKTLITSLLAVTMRRGGYTTAVLDADITGPSIPKAFGITGKASGNGTDIFPVKSKEGIGIMSVNLLLPDETDPVVWRGPVISGTVKQFWSNVIWGDVDFLFVDLPPGTGDVTLTVFQSLPLDGIVIVMSPQELVSLIVGKAVKMARMMNIPIIGLVENMSYAVCPDCGKKFHVFGESRLEEAARKYEISVTDSLPINPDLSALCDRGEIERFEGNPLNNIIARIRRLLEDDYKQEEGNENRGNI